MNPIQEAQAEVFAEILADGGVPVTINGETITGMVASTTVALEDGDAAFGTEAFLSVRYLKTALTSPAAYKSLCVVDGRTYAVTSLDRKPDAPVQAILIEPA